MVKCRNCRFMEEDWLTSLQGRGTYRFSYCGRLPHDCKVVDPEVKRECEYFEKKEERMANQFKCFDCGRFVSLGLGETAVVIRTDGRQQHYCARCLQQGAILKDDSDGSKQQWLKEQDWVKKLELW